ncbi:MAG: hypothetical protein IJQ97_02875 [Paludibacteraceae bacterium]|nr:hypothetical protein [Paludibacteraceae bacterium]
MLQQILTIVIIAGAIVGLWAYLRAERRHSCACGGSFGGESGDACGRCALKQQCRKVSDQVA